VDFPHRWGGEEGRSPSPYTWMVSNRKAVLMGVFFSVPCDSLLVLALSVRLILFCSVRFFKLGTPAIIQLDAVFKLRGWFFAFAFTFAFATLALFFLLLSSSFHSIPFLLLARCSRRRSLGRSIRWKFKFQGSLLTDGRGKRVGGDYIISNRW